ncbi:nuclear transport factor 2 family protein [Paenarthrobacter nicotinovorans]|uniref:Nuclear transport factor 2 family protein n=1 Tax=Paenarthrobacter nicotinovorans TaxID=29320 RepID=A0ABV0GLI7_PAENI
MRKLEIPDPVGAFIDAVNSHDEIRTLDAFTENGFVDDWGRKFEGRDAIKAWSDKEFVGARGILRPQSVSFDEGTIVVVGDWRSEHASGLSRFEFALEGERLASMTIRQG